MSITAIRDDAFAIIILILFGVSASAEVITNEEVVIDAAADGVASNFADPGFKTVSIVVSDGDISDLVGTGLAEGFENIGVNVVGNDQPDSAVQYAECDVLGFDFRYRHGDSRGFLRKRMIKREFSARLKFTLYDSRRSISEIRDMSLNYVDQIDPGLIDLVKSRSIEELDPPVPSSGMQRFIEPIVVTATVGGLVFLFFANR